jgi:pimeloyl-ACP methyl ester carboxylesterase
MSTAQVNGANLWFQAIGDGEPILMMHGVGLDHASLRPWHGPLADPARVIYSDHRWNGASERVGEPDIAMWNADAAALLDHLGIARATIYGHSYGSWIALAFAARYPDRVSRVVVSAASPAFDYVETVMANAQRKNPACAAKLAAGFASLPTKDADLAALWLEILPLYFHGAPRPEVLAQTRYSAHGFALGMAALQGFTTVDRLPAMKMPIQILAGRDDYITPPEQAQRIATLAPNARVVELAESGHFPFVEEQDRYLAAFRAFLAE